MSEQAPTFNQVREQGRINHDPSVLISRSDGRISVAQIKNRANPENGMVLARFTEDGVDKAEWLRLEDLTDEAQEGLAAELGADRTREREPNPLFTEEIGSAAVDVVFGGNKPDVGAEAVGLEEEASLEDVVETPESNAEEEENQVDDSEIKREIDRQIAERVGSLKDAYTDNKQYRVRLDGLLNELSGRLMNIANSGASLNQSDIMRLLNYVEPATLAINGEVESASVNTNQVDSLNILLHGDIPGARDMSPNSQDELAAKLQHASILTSQLSSTLSEDASALSREIRATMNTLSDTLISASRTPEMYVRDNLSTIASRLRIQLAAREYRGTLIDGLMQQLEEVTN